MNVPRKSVVHMAPHDVLVGKRKLLQNLENELKFDCARVLRRHSVEVLDQLLDAELCRHRLDVNVGSAWLRTVQARQLIVQQMQLE